MEISNYVVMTTDINRTAEFCCLWICGMEQFVTSPAGDSLQLQDAFKLKLI